jgi:hypothetical protein
VMKGMFVAPLPSTYTPQPLENLHLEMTSNTLSRRYELLVLQTVDVKNFRNVFDCATYYYQYLSCIIYVCVSGNLYLSLSPWMSFQGSVIFLSSLLFAYHLSCGYLVLYYSIAWFRCGVMFSNNACL